MLNRLFSPLTLAAAALGIAGVTIVAWSSAAQVAQPKPAAAPPPVVPKWSGPPCDSCEALPALEEQLFQQEYLRDKFKEFASQKRFPVPPDGYTKVEKAADGTLVETGTATDYMVDLITAEFTAFLNSSAGGGGGVGQAELGTDTDSCKLVLYVKDAKGKNVLDPKTKKPVTKPFDEKSYREALDCKPIADFTLTHERQHIADCTGESRQSVGAARAGGQVIDPSDWASFAAYDARGYEAGIANLRAYIAALAKDCGWQGSTNSTTKAGPTVPTREQANELGQKPTVPTPEQIRSLTNTLKGGGRK